jgi:hypothetical protein
VTYVSSVISSAVGGLSPSSRYGSPNG